MVTGLAPWRENTLEVFLLHRLQKLQRLSPALFVSARIIRRMTLIRSGAKNMLSAAKADAFGTEPNCVSASSGELHCSNKELAGTVSPAEKFPKVSPSSARIVGIFSENFAGCTIDGELFSVIEPDNRVTIRLTKPDAIRSFIDDQVDIQRRTVDPYLAPRLRRVVYSAGRRKNTTGSMHTLDVFRLVSFLTK